MGRNISRPGVWGKKLSEAFQKLNAAYGEIHGKEKAGKIFLYEGSISGRGYDLATPKRGFGDWKEFFPFSLAGHE